MGFGQWQHAPQTIIYYDMKVSIWFRTTILGAIIKWHNSKTQKKLFCQHWVWWEQHTHLIVSITAIVQYAKNSLTFTQLGLLHRPRDTLLLMFTWDLVGGEKVKDHLLRQYCTEGQTMMHFWSRTKPILHICMFTTYVGPFKSVARPLNINRRELTDFSMFFAFRSSY